MTKEERDKAIRILQWLHNNNFLFRSTEEDVKFATEYAIKALEQEPKWIPVSERLPEKNVWVLVTVEQSGVRHQEIMRRNNFIDTWTDNIDNYNNEITAWMPLPEPYRKEGVENE